MNEPNPNLVSAASESSATGPKPGRFRPGDPRINRGGRPKGSKAAVTEGTHPDDLAEHADRLVRIFVPEREVRCWLTRLMSPFLINLPLGFQIVKCRFDDIRKGILFTIRSDSLDRIASGALIPEMLPAFNGLKYSK